MVIQEYIAYQADIDQFHHFGFDVRGHPTMTSARG